MPLFMVHPKRPTFRRTITVGKASRQVVFEPGQPVELTDAEAEAIAKDVGHAVVRVTLQEKGELTRPRILWDGEEEPQPSEAPQQQKKRKRAKRPANPKSSSSSKPAKKKPQQPQQTQQTNETPKPPPNETT